MVIGQGIVASRFIDYELQSKYLIFAGSINASIIQNENRIEEEEATLKAALSAHPDSIFVYFSSCSCIEQDLRNTPYVQHKLRSEKLVQESGRVFFIFRLPKLVGICDEKISLVNYLVDAIFNQRHFELWQNQEINLIDIDCVHQIVSEILKIGKLENRIINVANAFQIPIMKLVHQIEDFLSLSAKYLLVNKGKNYSIDITEISPILRDQNLSFNEVYIERLLSKYFSHLVAPAKFLSIIVPTYNEELGIQEFYRRTKRVLAGLAPRFKHEIIFINDSSCDNTLQKIESLAQIDSSVKIINFSKNFGNQIAITAGIDFAHGDIAVVIDDDLQDPPEIIVNMIAKWDQGYKVVYGVRPNRKGVNPVFGLIAKLYYRVVANLSDTKIPRDTGDFRLLDRVVVESLKDMKEENRYYRGMVAWVGFSQTGILYERDKRYAGVSKFSLKKYVSFAINGLTSFTEKPLYISCLAGLFFTGITFIIAIILIVEKIVDPSFSIPGWTSLIVATLFFGGVQLLSVGILGVYISKIYREVKGRPLYIVQSTMNIHQ